MKPHRRDFLSMLDNSMRWTGIPARVAEQMSNAPSLDRKHRPLRWTPLWAIAFSCALFIFTLTWSSPLSATVLIASLSGVILMLGPAIHQNGPLGKPSLDDDEREAALRKDSFLFGLGLLAFLNCVGQPLLMILSRLQNWQFPHLAIVAMSALLLNATLLGSLPTLYASWTLPRLPQE